jgi:hypothetical protein
VLKHKFFYVLFPIIGVVGLVLALNSNLTFMITGCVLVLASLITAGLIMCNNLHSEKHQKKIVSNQHHVERVTELEGLYHTLQSNYFYKTIELQDKIDDLERFHRLSIGRELRLIELKNEIVRLQSNQPAPKATSSGTEPSV